MKYPVARRLGMALTESQWAHRYRSFAVEYKNLAFRVRNPFYVLPNKKDESGSK